MNDFEISDKIRDDRDREFVDQFNHLNRKDLMQTNIPLRTLELVTQIQQIDGHLHALTNHGRIWKFHPKVVSYKSPLVLDYVIEAHWSLIHENQTIQAQETKPANDRGREEVLGGSVGEDERQGIVYCTNCGYNHEDFKTCF